MTTKTMPAPAAAAPAAPAPAKAAPAAPAAAAPTTPAAAPAEEPKTAAAAAPAGEPAPIGGEPDEDSRPVFGDGVPLEGDAAATDKGDDAKKAEGDAKPEGKPIEYDFGQPPEGAPAYSPPVIDALKGVFGKHNVAAEAAKDIFATMLPVIHADTQAQWKANVTKQTAEWRTQVLQKHGDKANEVFRLADRALAKATPAFRSFVRESALAWHPDFIDLMASFGQRVTNDRSLKGTGNPPPAPPLSPRDEIAQQYEEAARKRGDA